MRKVLGGLVLLVFAVGFYTLRHDRASATVKAEMLRLTEDLDLSPDQHESTRQMVELHHEGVFRDATDIARDRGEMFDERLYQEELFRRMIDKAREDGDAELSERLSNQRNHIKLIVREE